MGSMESLLPTKRDAAGGGGGLFRSSSSAGSGASSRRGWLTRFLLLKKLDYRQWTCAVAAFLSFLFLFQMFLPVSVPDDSSPASYGAGTEAEDVPEALSSFLKGLEFGEGLELESVKVLERFRVKGGGDYVNVDNSTAPRRRFGIRKPKLALVFGDLLADPAQMMMVTIATALKEIGYDFEVYSPEDGPVGRIWKRLGVPVTIVQSNEQMQIAVDWLNFDGIIANSLEARSILFSLMQEPFKYLPLIWVVHENSLAIRSKHYTSSGQLELMNNWKKVFNRSTVIVFPNHVLPMTYSSFDAGNYHVIPGSPAELWETDIMMASNLGDTRAKMGYGDDDVLVAIVGSPFLYSGLLLENALILQALLPLVRDFPSHNDSSSRLKILVLDEHSISDHGVALEAIAGNLSYPNSVVKHMPADGNASYIISAVDLVIYGSFLEEQSFPEILLKSMFIGKPVVAPTLSVIKKHVEDRVNGYLFPKEKLEILTQIVSELIVNGNLSPLVSITTSVAKRTAKNLMVQECVLGYALLLENVLQLPSEVAVPSKALEILPNLIHEWRWDLFEELINSKYENRISRSYRFLEKVEELWNHSHRSGMASTTNQVFFYELWLDEKNNGINSTRRRREEEELKDRNDQSHGTWEDVYRNVKRIERAKNDLHERDEGELERTGQPLCIYEPFSGEGSWPFLHLSSLYRGIGLSTKGRRPRTDDIDALSRLPLLGNVYYRDALGEFGAFFAIAYRIDRVHKNAWIGFQSWRATARKSIQHGLFIMRKVGSSFLQDALLSKTAEKALLDAIETKRHGDALYFWVRMDNDPRNPSEQDFWSFCDAINAGNCRIAFSAAFKRMYGLQKDLDLPPMPQDGDTWSVMTSWALPTRSFQEFVMFSRMFVDALDAEIYDEHYASGHCYLSLSKDKHCYTRVLELLVNVWAYHSARVMVYMNPETGLMQEQHNLKSRRGNMWVKWFSYSTLKNMDEELAEVADSDPPNRRWLWPKTGEVIWQGVFEKERNMRNRQKEKRKQQSKEKLNRMRKKHRQKVIGKFVKPPPDNDTNSTMRPPTDGREDSNTI